MDNGNSISKPRGGEGGEGGLSRKEGGGRGGKFLPKGVGGGEGGFSRKGGVWFNFLMFLRKSYRTHSELLPKSQNIHKESVCTVHGERIKIIHKERICVYIYIYREREIDR